MKSFKSVKEKVRELLIKDRSLADNIKKLCWEFWKDEAKEKHNMKFMFFLTYDVYNSLTPEGTIDRAKRILEKFNPELRGYTYNKRHIKEPKVKKIVNESKWDEISEINRYK